MSVVGQQGNDDKAVQNESTADNEGYMNKIILKESSKLRLTNIQLNRKHRWSWQEIACII